MKKKVLAIVLAFCLVLGMSATAFAVDGTAADGPSGGTTTNASNGSAIITRDGTEFQAENDDDNVAKTAETTADGADIAVWAKITGVTEGQAGAVYNLGVAWGAMEFEFNRGTATWDPGTHTYSTQGAAAWTAIYVNGINNKITVTNNSNRAIDATFAVELEDTAFNDVAGADSVVGNFFDTNADAVDAALVLTTVANVANKLASSKLSLPTADSYTDAGNPVAAGARTGDVFFAFSGTPDATKVAATDVSKVGTITITFADATPVAP